MTAENREAQSAGALDASRIRRILATDCGSTTSKARLFAQIGGEYRYVASGEAPTTVEAPYEDVTLGVTNAIREIEESTHLKLLEENGIMTPCTDSDRGCDVYISASSAGGGLQMTVAGVIRSITTESAERAALGAGAIVMDVVSTDDGKQAFQKIERIRSLRPDMILVAGGTDGGNVPHVVEVLELITTAEPRARLGAGYELPIVYAGNCDAREHARKMMNGKFALQIVDNIRPRLETENPGPARDAIHQLFLEHVMSHAPGYGKLMAWTSVPVMPTPAAEGRMFRTIAELRHVNIIGVGLGGATTNVYSVYNDKFVRTVSANLGMSYSICNVLRETGVPNIHRWIPFPTNADFVRSMCANKMIRPTTIPQTCEELMLEHAVAREALRLGFLHHKQLARGLRGLRVERTIGDVLKSGEIDSASYIDMLRVNLIAGTGGLLSHAPRRAQAALMLVDGFQPEGITILAQDSIFMMPHLGLLSTVHPEAALEIFEKDCLIRLGTCIAPRGPGGSGKIMVAQITMPDGSRMDEELSVGELRLIPLRSGETATVDLSPAKHFDVGEGPGKRLNTKIEGGEVGVMIDCRGRPISIPEDHDRRLKLLNSWLTEMDAYPQVFLAPHNNDTKTEAC